MRNVIYAINITLDGCCDHTKFNPDDDGRAAGDEQMSLIYSMLMSADGSVEDEHGRFGWAQPDEEVFSYINQAGGRQSLKGIK